VRGDEVIEYRAASRRPGLSKNSPLGLWYATTTAG
jgi:hypothetical protein